MTRISLIPTNSHAAVIRRCAETPYPKGFLGHSKNTLVDMSDWGVQKYKTRFILQFSNRKEKTGLKLPSS